MNKYLKKILLWTFVFGTLLFIVTVNADAINDASQISVATNSNIAKTLNDLANMAITKPDLWYRTKSGLWYYFENRWSTTRTSWFVDPRDGYTYYLRPENGIMALGWVKIGDDEYYFNDDKEAEKNFIELGGGFYEKIPNTGTPYGALCKDCMTPDGKMVDKDGKLIK